MTVFITLLCLALAGQAEPGTPATNQLKTFKNSTNGPIGILTTTTGRTVPFMELETLNTDLITNGLFIEQQSALNRENIPERVVHGKGTGAFGYFEVTHDVTDITNVAFLSKVGKTTPVAVRFSPAFGEKGGPDIVRGPYGYAAKFYTEEGNFDLVAFSTDTFLFKDPIYFTFSVHSSKRNPKTNLLDPNALFDFITYHPEALNTQVQTFGDIGVPFNYRYMPGHSIHTYQVENGHKEVSFVRLKMTPDLGVKTLNQSETVRLTQSNPDLYTEDLYNAIESGDYPSWTFGMQIVSKEEVKNAEFDMFDVTFRWPEDKYKVRPIGKFMLNKNPDDHHRDVEQMSFCPGNLVDGIRGVDKLFEARSFAYRDAGLYRLGVNFNNIEVNRPKNTVYTYTRGGVPPVRSTFGGMPNYYQNSFNGPVPAEVTRTTTKRIQVYTEPGFTNAGQIADYYNGLPEESRQRLVENLSSSLALTYPSIQEKILRILGVIDAGLKCDVERGLAKAAKKKN